MTPFLSSWAISTKHYFVFLQMNLQYIIIIVQCMHATSTVLHVWLLHLSPWIFLCNPSFYITYSIAVVGDINCTSCMTAASVPLHISIMHCFVLLINEPTVLYSCRWGQFNFLYDCSDCPLRQCLYNIMNLQIFITFDGLNQYLISHISKHSHLFASHFQK